MPSLSPPRKTQYHLPEPFTSSLPIPTPAPYHPPTPLPHATGPPMSRCLIRLRLRLGLPRIYVDDAERKDRSSIREDGEILRGKGRGGSEEVRAFVWYAFPRIEKEGLVPGKAGVVVRALVERMQLCRARKQ